MPRFICPIDWCYFHNGEDCAKSNIFVKSRMDDFDVTIACQHQKGKPKICYLCGKSFESENSDICIDCMCMEG